MKVIRRIHEAGLAADCHGSVRFHTDAIRFHPQYYGKMDSLQFKALARDNNFTRVVISRNRDSHVIVSAILICDNESQGLTAYNYLRDNEGQLVKFDYIGEAENTIRKLGYKGPITLPVSGEKLPRLAEALKK